MALTIWTRVMLDNVEQCLSCGRFGRASHIPFLHFPARLTFPPQLPPQRSENFAGSESGELLEPELLPYGLLSGAQSDEVHSCPIWVAGALTARKYPGTRSASCGGKGLKRRTLRDLGLPLSPSLLCSTPVFDPPTLV